MALLILHVKISDIIKKWNKILKFMFEKERDKNDTLERKVCLQFIIPKIAFHVFKKCIPLPLKINQKTLKHLYKNCKYFVTIRLTTKTHYIHHKMMNLSLSIGHSPFKKIFGS